jgi:hypothetical protein
MWSNRGDFHPVLTENKRAGWQLNHVRIAGQFKINLSVRPGLKEAIWIVCVKFDQQGPCTCVDSVGGGGDDCFEGFIRILGKMQLSGKAIVNASPILRRPRQHDEITTGVPPAARWR